jgi:hypothetical protein
MKWKALKTKVDYEAGSTRKRQIFAWLPTYVNGYIKWLSFYEVLEFYEVRIINTRVDNQDLSFKVTKWIEISRR